MWRLFLPSIGFVLSSIARPIAAEDPCASAPSREVGIGVTSIELMPRSTVTIQAWGQCVIIENRFREPTIIPVPVYYSDAWHCFATREHDDSIKVTPCK